MSESKVREHNVLKELESGEASIQLSESLRLRLVEYYAFWQGTVSAASAAANAANQAKGLYEQIIESQLTDLGLEPDDLDRAIDMKKGILKIKVKKSPNGSV